MFSSAFKADRLRVNLQLVIHRLKLLEKKKTEQSQKARKEIADYLAAGKDERARIRVEHIIREDYLVEAMEILELYCDLLLARFSLVHVTNLQDSQTEKRSLRLTQVSRLWKQLDPGLAESISSLIWATPRLQSEVPELKIVSDQLCAKYSQDYGQLCRTNEIGTVNARLMCKLNLNTLPQVLVEEYLTEIARNYNVPWKPKAALLAEAPADLLGTGCTEGPGKDVLGGGRGFAEGADDPLEDSPLSAQGPSPGPPAHFPSFPPEGQNNVCKRNDFLPSLPPRPGCNPQPGSGGQVGFEKFMLPEFPAGKPPASLSLDPCDTEEVDFEDLHRRLEMLKRTT